MFLKKIKESLLKIGNLYKVWLSYFIMPKKDLNSSKTKSATVKGTIPLNQKEIIKRLIGIVGNNEQDVVGKIITLWLYNEGYLSQNKMRREKWRKKL